ncbi:MAG: hypothetical protein P4K94_12010 [Terracidiphilus sp.]|jgi:hypothetical protein|nr:hypothetical protein [Terracidiphilus sp.]
MQFEGPSIQVSFRLDPRIFAAIEKQLIDGRDVSAYAHDLVVASVINANLLDPEFSKEFSLKGAILSRCHSTSLRVFRAQGFSPDFTYRVVRALEADPLWLEDYTALVRDDPFKTGNQRKGSINRAIGACVLKSIGGIVAKDDKERPILVPVKGSIIQKYTKMESYTLPEEPTE